VRNRPFYLIEKPRRKVESRFGQINLLSLPAEGLVLSGIEGCYNVTKYSPFMEKDIQNQNQMNIPETDALWRVFEERKREVEESRDRWLRWFIANIVILFLVAVLIFIGLTTGTGFAAASWLEFGVALPLVYSAIFFHAQHSKAREYLEEYSFKALVARSLGTCRKMLKEDMDGKSADEQKKYLDFVIGSLKDLHTPPREIISKHPVRDEGDVKVGVVEKLGDIFKKFIPKI